MQFRAILLPFSLMAILGSTAAPGDQYFGKLKMSAVHIRYEIVSIRDRYWTHKILPTDAMHLASLTEDAFDDWARRYPKDDWLASTAYNFAQLYGLLPGTEAHDRAVALLKFVTTRFPHTSYAASSRTQLHRGVPVRPYPAWATAASAAPSASPQPSASPRPSSTPSAGAPSPTPSAGRIGGAVNRPPA